MFGVLTLISLPMLIVNYGGNDSKALKGVSMDFLSLVRFTLGNQGVDAEANIAYTCTDLDYMNPTKCRLDCSGETLCVFGVRQFNATTVSYWFTLAEIGISLTFAYFVHVVIEKGIEGRIQDREISSSSAEDYTVFVRG